ncbi:MAG: hypothetical protein J7K00_00815 [Candidatus Diapherotrites archaeon]|nr:hypothetical protein [Candidatus Diapherotrites archaeon]
MIETIQPAIHGATMFFSLIAFLLSLLIAKNYSNGKMNNVWKILSVTFFVLFTHYAVSAANFFYQTDLLKAAGFGTEILFVLLLAIALYRHLRTLNSI